ncbi:MAG: amino acid deaminase [Solirubrobacteraceae bacterium]
MESEHRRTPLTEIDRSAVAALYDTPIAAGTKGLPLRLPAGATLHDVASSGWSIFRDEVTMPVMVLKESALKTNLRVMADYCRANNVLLCPHGKTTMSPQLFQRQIDAGAWGLTAATPAHLCVYRQFGVQRILYANPLVEPSVISWLAAELNRCPPFEFLCLADSVEAIRLLDRGLRDRCSRTVGILVEVGYAGGRCGARDAATVDAIAAAVDASPSLHLRGVECFEGLLSKDDSPAGLARIDAFLHDVAAIVARLSAGSSLSDSESILVSAGGSAYFDRVVQAFVAEWLGPPTTVVLRSGCYLTHDGGFYEDVSPLGRRAAGASAFSNAIEIWSAVLSRPEPELAITSMGRRDAPTDMRLPVPRYAVRDRERPPIPVESASISGLSDQHAHVVIPPTSELGPGDLIGCSISHPCTAFDRWRVIPVVDDDYTICDAILTYV